MREWSKRERGAPADMDGLVLVVDAERDSRAELAGDMRALGLAVVEASSPLEAIDALDREPDAIGTVVVAPTIRSASQADLARFIAETYPAVLNVLVRGQHWHRGKADHRWLLFDLQGELVNLPAADACRSRTRGIRRHRLAQGSGYFRAVKPPQG